ncbi:MAG: LamG domain-containing protein, partial [Planctomycetota bacterium]
MRKRLPFVTVGLACLVCGGSAAGERAVGEEATRIVSKYKVAFTRPPRRIPTNKVVDAPLLGNGDIGVAVGGAGDSQAFFIGKNDFWSRRARRVITVGRVTVHIPALAGASYACEQDLLNAEVRGGFTKGGLTVEMRSWTAATENLLVTELTCRGAGAIPVAVSHSIGPGGGGGGPRGGGRIRENNNHVNIGREQHGRGRWGFRGMIDEVRIYDRALSGDEIKALSKLKDVTTGLVRHWKFDEAAGTTVHDSAGKGARGQIRNAVWWTKGKRGPALKLDGKGHVDCGKLKLASQVTIAAWIYIGERPGEANYIVSKGAWNSAYSLGLSGGKLRMAVGDSFVQTPGPLPVKKWLHVAGTFDGATVRVFVDGAWPGGDKARDRDGKAEPRDRGSERDILWFTRAADSADVKDRRTAAVATRVLGAEAEVGEGSIRFELRPGGRVHLVTAVLSDLDDADNLPAAKRRVSGVTAQDLEELNGAHRAWWRRFWS